MKRAGVRGSTSTASSKVSGMGKHRHCDFWNRRHDAVAVLDVGYEPGRYRQGEVGARMTYHLRGGGLERDEGHRVYLGSATGPVIRDLWHMVFDEVALAQQYGVRTVVIRLDLTEMPEPWARRVRAVAEIVACELDALVRGTSLDSVVR